MALVGVIDYGASNLQSVCNALARIGESYDVIDDPERLGVFKKVILPGVGAARPAMEMLQKHGFDKRIPKLNVPVLGICLGMQLLGDFSEEEDTACLSIIPGRVKKFQSGLKVPQIGWNQVNVSNMGTVPVCGTVPILEGIADGSYFYFVNSYYFDSEPKFSLGTTLYGSRWSSIVEKENFIGVQFHPEKSGEQGLRLLKNFCLC